jgi:hypothetical protein
MAMSIVPIHWKHDSLVDEAQRPELSLGSIHPCNLSFNKNTSPTEPLLGGSLILL